MATWPAYARLIFEGFEEQPESAVITTPMEEGPAKVRRVKSRVMVSRPAVALFQTRADYLSFVAWFRSASGANGGAAWFDWRNPVTGTTVSARVVGGLMRGTPQSPSLSSWKVSLTLESWDA